MLNVQSFVLLAFVFDPVGWPQWVWGQISPDVCKDGARQFFKIEEKIIGGGEE